MAVWRDLFWREKASFFGNTFWATLLPIFGGVTAKYVLWNWKVKMPSFLAFCGTNLGAKAFMKLTPVRDNERGLKEPLMNLTFTLLLLGAPQLVKVWKILAWLTLIHWCNKEIVLQEKSILGQSTLRLLYQIGRPIGWVGSGWSSCRLSKLKQKLHDW